MIRIKFIGKCHKINNNEKKRLQQFIELKIKIKKSECFNSDFRGKAPFVGVFTYRMPELLILDPKLVDEIFVGKFKHFRNNYTNVNSISILSMNINKIGMIM